MDQLRKKIKDNGSSSSRSDAVTVCCGARESDNRITEQLRKSMTCMAAALSISHQFSLPLLLKSIKSCNYAMLLEPGPLMLDVKRTQ